MLILRTPKGWTGPKFVDGKPVENTWRAHQVPFAELREKPDHLRLLEEWMRSYKPEELFDEKGHLRPEIADVAPKGRLRMGMNAACQRRTAAAAAQRAQLPRLRRANRRPRPARLSSPPASSANCFTP